MKTAQTDTTPEKKPIRQVLDRESQTDSAQGKEVTEIPVETSEEVSKPVKEKETPAEAEEKVEAESYSVKEENIEEASDASVDTKEKVSEPEDKEAEPEVEKEAPAEDKETEAKADPEEVLDSEESEKEAPKKEEPKEEEIEAESNSVEEKKNEETSDVSTDKIEKAPEEVEAEVEKEEPEEVKTASAESSVPLRQSDSEASEPKEESPPKKKSFFYSDVPKVDKNAPLKIDGESDGNEDLPKIEKSNKKLFLLGIVVFVITIVATIGVGFFIINNASTGKKEAAKEPKAAENTPTPAPAIDKKEWNFEVLNGSGEAGKAKKTADSIEALGYTVDGTGNAGKSDYTGVTVSFIKEIKSDVKDVIMKDLKKEFGTITEDDAPTDKTKSSILIIIGK